MLIASAHSDFKTGNRVYSCDKHSKSVHRYNICALVLPQKWYIMRLEGLEGLQLKFTSELFSSSYSTKHLCY